MKFYGLEKLSLVDYDGRTAATVFTGGCNFACPYCHNAGLVFLDKNAVCIPENDVLEYLTKRKGLLDGLTITGGEPTLHRDLPDFCARVKAIGYDVKLDTNGTSPAMLAELTEKKLVACVAMDIKNSPSKYPLTAGMENADVEAVKESAALLMRGGCAYEFRTTVVRELHEESDFFAIGEWLRGAEKYFLQKFRNTGGCLSEGYSEVSEETAQGYRDILSLFIKNVSLRGY